MEKLTRSIGGLLILAILIISCNLGKRQQIASFSDLMRSTPLVEEINYSSPKRLKYINIHCTASKGELTKEWLLNFFKNERGWSKPGYNLVIHMDGTVDTLVPYNNDGLVQYSEISYGVRGVNSESINIAYTGGVDARMQPKDTRTPSQKNTMNLVLSKLRCQFPYAQVLGHRDHGAPKACPSFDVRSEYGMDIVQSDLFDNQLDSLEN